MQNCEQGPTYHLESDIYKHAKIIAVNLPKDADLRLKWATIFHDIAKPETREEIVKDGKSKVSFLKYDVLGAEKVKPILQRLRFSSKEIDDISWLVAQYQELFKKFVPE